MGSIWLEGGGGGSTPKTSNYRLVQITIEKALLECQNQPTVPACNLKDKYMEKINIKTVIK